MVIDLHNRFVRITAVRISLKKELELSDGPPLFADLIFYFLFHCLFFTLVAIVTLCI